MSMAPKTLPVQTGMLCARVPVEIVNWVDQTCDERNISRSDLLREILGTFIEGGIAVYEVDE
jgi:hypothetical protein